MTDTRWGRGVALPPMLQLRPRPIEHLFISRQSKTLSCLLSYYSSMHSLSFLHASLQRKMPYKFYRFARDGFLLLVLRETERTTVLRYLNCKPRDSHCRSITFSGSRRRILPPFLPSAQPTAGTENADHFPKEQVSVNMTADCNDSGPCFSCCLELGLDGFMGQAHLNKKLEAQRMSNLSNFIYKVEEE